jgi:hypothetical protein
MGAEFVLEGMEKLLANLEEYKHRKLVKMAPALKLGGQALANDVKALAPYKTGTYRRSIHVEPPTNDDVKPYVMVGTDLPYGRRLEYGFYAKTDSLGRKYYQMPQPHFRPPLDTEMDKYIRIMKGELVDEKYDTALGELVAQSMINEVFS